jgi:hypothetical protein
MKMISYARYHCKRIFYTTVTTPYLGHHYQKYINTTVPFLVLTGQSHAPKHGYRLRPPSFVHPLSLPLSTFNPAPAHPVEWWINPPCSNPSTKSETKEEKK